MSTNNPRVSQLQEGFVPVNGLPTHVMTYGGWLDETQFSQNPVIIVIPGNPGIIEYYQLFMESLHKALGEKYMIWGISHAGHVKVPENYRTPKLSGNEDLYSLQGQIKHKLAFIEDYVPESASVILIGHSIGSYISLSLTDQLPERRVRRAIFLFPTIERLYDSPQGRWVWPIVAYLRPMVLILVYLLSYLSTPMQYNLLEWFFSNTHSRIPACAYTASLNTFDTHCTNKWMYMAKTEFESVNQLNVRMVEDHLPRLVMYYGERDHWCPVSYYEGVKRLFPDGNIRLCEKGFDHAFVLESSEPVAELVAGWIKNFKSATEVVI